MKRNVYLKTMPIAEAVSLTRQALDRDALIRAETVGSHESSGRVLAGPVFARYSSPTAHSAAMDGYAMRASSTFSAREGSPVTLAAGQDCFAVNTGNHMPDDCDAVVMIENVQQLPNGDISVEAPVFPWQHVRRIGEDIVATELLFARNRLLTPYDVGALLSGGIWEVEVWQRPHLKIIPTGNEILDFSARPDPGKGQVVESNSQVLAALARDMGFIAERVPPVPDDPEILHKTLVDAISSGAHVVIFCAGSSAGSKDFTRAIIEREGKVLVHGIAAMPGKPALAGICGKTLVLGAPGYPVSNVVAFEQFFAPVISWLGHREKPHKPEMEIELARKAPSQLGIEEFVRLCAGKVGDKIIGMPLGRGAGNITTLTKAQAVARIPAEKEGLNEGTVVKGELTVSEDTLNKMLICIGSHDNTLDLLADSLMGLDNPFGLASTHVGSMGGITALKNGTCHMAGMHLLDEDTGDFNFSWLDKHFPEHRENLVLFNLAIRHQGIIVPKGNPLGIKGVEDLKGGKARFINRQRGAGTRILFDWHLKKSGMSPADVKGYEKEETTHMAVAVNVLTGSADCGLGIYAAASALDLGFEPLARERYDLAVPTRFMEDPRIVAVLELLRSDVFKKRIEELGGYETNLTGMRMEPGMKLG